MHRDQLAPAVRHQLRRLPVPYSNHYGVVPLPPPEGGLFLHDIARRREAAIAAVARVDTLAKTLDNPFLISRLLVRQEAVSSSAIEGTNSTLDELLQVEETGDDAAFDTKQVRDYVLILSQFIEQARAGGFSIFTLDLIKTLHAHIMREDPTYRDAPVNCAKASCGSAQAATFRGRPGTHHRPTTSSRACRRHSTTCATRACSR